MKILQVTNAFPTEKTPIKGIFIREQIDSLQSIGISSDVFHIDVDAKGLFEYIKSIPSLRNQAKDYDLVHCHHILSAIVGLIAGLRKKMIVSFLSDGSHNLKGRYRFLGFFFYYFVCLFVKNKIFKSRLPSGLFSHGGYLIPNGVDFNRFVLLDREQAKKKIGLDPNKIYILFVSSNRHDRPEKRFDFFEKVMISLRKNDVNIEPLIMTNVSREETVWYYNASSVHLLPSDCEGSPNSVKEALACGTPVVARDVGSVQFLLDGCSGCYLFREDDVSLVTSLVLKSITFNDRRSIIKSLKKKNIDVKVIARRIHGLYSRLV